MEAQIKDNGNLELFLPEERRGYIEDRMERHGEITVWYDMFESYWANGSFQPVNPESHMVGLTSDPYIVVEEATTEGNGDLTVHGSMWHYPRYMLESVVEKLLDGERVELQKHCEFEGERIESHYNKIHS